MENAMKSHVKAKIFIGFELKVDLKMALSQNSQWNAAAVSKTTDLRQIHFNEKEYIGVHLEHDMITMKHVRDQAAIVRTELERFCPNYNTVNLKINVFPQVFVA